MDTKTAKAADRIRLTVGAYSFAGRVERLAAPKTAALLDALLPLQGMAMHARWSGEAGWMPLAVDLSLVPENAVTFPQAGHLLLYAGPNSEAELLIPYGACSFGCRAGQLAGNHVITLDDVTQLQSLGETLLKSGAQRLTLTAVDGAAS